MIPAPDRPHCSGSAVCDCFWKAPCLLLRTVFNDQASSALLIAGPSTHAASSCKPCIFTLSLLHGMFHPPSRRGWKSSHLWVPCHSRIIDSKHSTADVIGGFLLGALIGLAFVLKVGARPASLPSQSPKVVCRGVFLSAPSCWKFTSATLYIPRLGKGSGCAALPHLSVPFRSSCSDLLLARYWFQCKTLSCRLFALIHCAPWSLLPQQHQASHRWQVSELDLQTQNLVSECKGLQPFPRMPLRGQILTTVSSQLQPPAGKLCGAAQLEHAFGSCPLTCCYKHI